MMEQFPKRVFFFNDAEFALDGAANAADIDRVRSAFARVSRCIQSPQFSVIDYEMCRLNFEAALQPAHYDEVMCLGSKGTCLYAKVAHLLSANRTRELKIRRVFHDESLDSFDFGMSMSALDRAALEGLRGKRLLLVDDIVYTGQTLRYVLNLLDSSNSVTILTMLAMEQTRKQLQHPLLAGLIIPGAPWSGHGEEQDLWCFRDLIESDAVVYGNGHAQSFIEREDIMRRYLFGDSYGVVTEVVAEIRHLFK